MKEASKGSEGGREVRELRKERSSSKGIVR